MPLADARARMPGLDVVPADPAADVRALQVLAGWCGSFSPWTAPEPPAAAGGAGLWLDATGCSHLFGGEAGMLTALVDRVRRLGFTARAAIADTPGAAWAIARFGPEAEVAVVASGGTESALAGLPVAALRIPPDADEGLCSLGLRCIGDLLALPRGPLAARFGKIVATRLDQALGRTGEPISPLVPAPAHRERIAPAEPIGRREDVERGLALLLDALCRRLERGHAGVRRLDFALYRVDGGMARVRIGTHHPARDPVHLARLFAEHLDDLDLGEGAEVLTLSAPEIEPLLPEQLSLSARRGEDPAAGGWQEKADVAPLLDRLVNRLGRGSVTRLALEASHVPERASAEVPAAGGRPAPLAPPPGRGGRPLRLFPRPLPIDAVAPVPDGPPVLFRWRRVVHRIAHAEGPERIAPEWWRTRLPWTSPWQQTTRDYYQVEDEAGRRFWLYREGLYAAAGGDAGVEADAAPAPAPRWFVHGLFA